jgi:ubiquinone/menaquinone biosynthesis C-methylase UbiE
MELLIGRKEAAKFLGLKPPKKIIDVATGTGSLAGELAKLGHRVVGIDKSIEAIAKARDKYGSYDKLVFETGDAINLRFKDGEFDAATISFALHDMDFEVVLKTLKEMKRVTKPGGLMMVVDYNPPSKNWVARLTYPLIKISESENYPKFIDTNIGNLLGDIGLEIIREKVVLGMVRLVVIKR